MHFHLLVWIDWFHHWKFNLALSFFSFVYLTASDQVFIQMKASLILICRLNFKSFHVCCQTWLYVLLYSGKITAYMLKIKQFWRPFAVEACLCVPDNRMASLEMLHAIYLLNCHQIFLFFFFSPIFPQWTFTDDLGVLNAGTSLVGREVLSGQSCYCGITDLWMWKVAAGSYWRKKHPEPSKISYTEKGVQISPWMLIYKSEKVRIFLNTTNFLTL